MARRRPPKPAANAKSPDASVSELVAGVLAGERAAIARALRVVDDLPAASRALAGALHAQRKNAQVVGITGYPGSGKSTLCDALIQHLRATGKRVGVLAVDPSSPFSGGAILGDRIRMNRHTTDRGVFIRSLATRGALGGLSRAAYDSVRVLDAAGFEVILIETVGVGQDEVDVARLAETTVVVTVPGLGDDVQALKAGLLEVADLFVINKADREGVPDVERSLRQLLAMAPAKSGWQPRIVRTVALRDEGIGELWQAIAAHHDFARSPEGAGRAAAQRRDLFERLLDAGLVERGRTRLGEAILAARTRVTAEDGDPYAEAQHLLDVREDAP